MQRSEAGIQGVKDFILQLSSQLEEMGLSSDKWKVGCILGDGGSLSWASEGISFWQSQMGKYNWVPIYRTLSRWEDP